MTNTEFPRGRKRRLILTVLIAGLLAAAAVAPYQGGADGAPRAGAAAAVQQLDTSVSGKWSALISMKDVPVHLSVLPSGKLLYWGREKDTTDNKYDVEGYTRTHLWNPLFEESTKMVLNGECSGTPCVPNTTSGTNLFCSGHSFLPDGKLLVTGGQKRNPNNPANSDNYGEEDLNIFDPKTESWTTIHNGMGTKGRWYPFNLTLQDGSTIIISGGYRDTSGFKVNQTPQIFGLDGVAGPYLAADTTNFLTSSTYPYIHLTSQGKVFLAALPDDRASRYFDVAANRWTSTTALPNLHDQGTSVMYAPDRVLIVGGKEAKFEGSAYAGMAPGTRADVMNVSALPTPSPQWEQKSDMHHARRHATGALLPDGTVFVAGGTKCAGGNHIVYTDESNLLCSDGAILKPEIWNPGQDVWQEMAEHQKPRLYHSVVALLPDARILVGGGGLPVAVGENDDNGAPCPDQNSIKTTPCASSGHRNVEIFSPPYLFESHNTLARRPAITSAPRSAQYGQQFTVGVGDVNPSDISGVVLIRLPSVTHTFNQDQRRVELAFTPSQEGKSLTVTAPPSGFAAPPGPYMLFLLRNNTKKTPSVAKIIRIGSVSLNDDSVALPSGKSSAGDDFADQTVTINVSAPATTNWEAAVPSGATWLSITSSSAGAGSGSVTLKVSPNRTPDRRYADVTVSISGQPHTKHTFRVNQAAEFADVPFGHWAREAIQKIYAQGLTGGCEYDSSARLYRYCLEDNVRREQMAAFLVRALGVDLPPPSDLNPSFPQDVSPSHLFFTQIEALKRLGITNGCGQHPVTAQDMFCPSNHVTREQMAVFLVRALGIRDPIPPGTVTFPGDVPTGHPYFKWIEELARREITTGCGQDPNTGQNRFCPASFVTRAEMAVFLKNTFNGF